MRALPIAVTLLGLALASCEKPSDEGKSTEPASASEAAEHAELTDAQKAILVAKLPTPYNTGDIAHGKQLFAVCKACHTLVQGGANMTGPNLWGVFGRKAGSVAGFNYSDGMKAATFSWDAARLDAWIEKPTAVIAGTKMTYAGMKEAKDRLDVIAYLKSETSGATEKE
ncbi:MAG: cytochrome c family protein [Phenylobacterium zucineum]|nr:MAG: cytochrome c family protein [Phenylobacterium zucineum]